MKHPFVLCFLFLFFTPSVNAGIDPAPATGARVISLGRAYVGVGGNFWSLYHNPAGIAGMSATQVGAFFEQRFFLSELTYGGAGAVFPFKGSQAVGISLSSFGFSAYRENQLTASYAVQFFDKVRIGSTLHYAQLAIADYGSRGAVFADIGIQYQLNAKVSLGVSAYNVNRARLEGQNGSEFIPTQLTAGLAFRASDKVLLVADVQKDIDHATSFRAGIEYKLLPVLAIRTGVSTEPLTYNIGLGLAYKGLELDLAFGVHEQLGLSPFMSLSYPFGQ
ncbi:MAG: hypothetical protein AAF927_18925 [Bacteroidota bacterium]